MDSNATIFHKIYKIEKKIGVGAFGIVYAGINAENQQKIAIKLEDASSKVPQLLFEARLYYHMHNDILPNKVLPHVYYAGNEGKYNVMIMELLGRDLEYQLHKCGGKFSLKTVCMIAIQLIDRVSFLHDKSYIHRDLKPDNFLCGRDSNSRNIYLIDYGLAKRYIQKNGQHIKQAQSGCFTGTARYASVNTHLGYELSRKDDMESLGYCLIFFLKGSLPWAHVQVGTTDQKLQRVYEIKRSTQCQTLCENLPKEFYTYFQYVSALRFEEAPDYQKLKGLFEKLLKSKNYSNDSQFDWESRNESPIQIGLEKEASQQNTNQKQSLITIQDRPIKQAPVQEKQVIPKQQQLNTIQVIKETEKIRQENEKLKKLYKIIAQEQTKQQKPIINQQQIQKNEVKQVQQKPQYKIIKQATNQMEIPDLPQDAFEQIKLAKIQDPNFIYNNKQKKKKVAKQFSQIESMSYSKPRIVINQEQATFH